MSTKTSIKYVDNTFHVYTDLFDEESIYLELIEPSFECHIDKKFEKTLTIKLPESVWNMIVSIGPLTIPKDDFDEMKAFREKKLTAAVDYTI